MKTKNERPNNGETYYWVRSDTGDICKSEWIDGVSHHEFKWSIGNVCHSFADARAAKIEAMAKVEDRRRPEK